MQPTKTTNNPLLNIASINTIQQHIPLNSFEEKVTNILRLTEDFKTAQVGVAVLQTLTALKKETSELYGTALQDKTQRISIRRQQIASQEVDPTAQKIALDRAEQEESLQLKIKNQQAEKLLYTVGETVIQALKRFTEPNNTALKDPDIQTSIIESLHWCTVSFSRPQHRCQLAHAKNLLELGKISDAYTLVKDLSYFFPESLKMQCREIATLQSEEKIAQRLTQFLATNQALFNSLLEKTEKTPAPAPSFADLMQHRTIVETFLKYVSVKELRVATNSRNFREITAQSLPAEYFNDKAKHIPSARSFSLTTSPIVCRTCENVAYMAMLRNSHEFGLLSEELRSNITVIKFAIFSALESCVHKKTNPEKEINAILNQIPENVREIITAKVKYSIDKATAYSRLNPQFRRDIKTKNDKLTNIVRLFFHDKHICMAAIGIKPSLFEFIDPLFQNKKEFVRKAVQSDGRLLKFASQTLRNDKEIVTLAVQQNGCALEFVSSELQENEDIVSLAVCGDMYALKLAPSKFKNNEKIVALAVQHNGYALMHASSELQNNEHIVSLAVQQNGHALCFASLQQRDNPKVVELAILQNRRAIGAAGPNARLHPRIFALRNDVHKYFEHMSSILQNLF